MSIQAGKEYLKQFGLEDKVLEFDVSSATVELAAQAVGVEGKRIAKKSYIVYDNIAKTIKLYCLKENRYIERGFAA